MIALAAVLYLGAFWLIYIAWKNRQAAITGPIWRRTLTRLAFAAVFAAAAFDMAFTISWLYNGGSPHGLDPAPGLWLRIRPLLKWPFLLGFLLPIFGKLKERIYLYASVVTTFIVGNLIYMLQMD